MLKALAIAVLLLVASFAATRIVAADPPTDGPPGRDPCDHGNTGSVCRPDPQPDRGKDCEKHGLQGGVNEDHCGPAPTPTQPLTITQPSPTPTPTTAPGSTATPTATTPPGATPTTAVPTPTATATTFVPPSLGPSGFQVCEFIGGLPTGFVLTYVNGFLVGRAFTPGLCPVTLTTFVVPPPTPVTIFVAPTPTPRPLVQPSVPVAPAPQIIPSAPAPQPRQITPAALGDGGLADGR